MISFEDIRINIIKYLLNCSSKFIANSIPFSRRLDQKGAFGKTSLDTFNSMGQNIVTELDAWLTFFSCTDAEHIVRLVQKYPKFLEYYKDIAVFRTKPKELIYMFSEALEILDRNTANYITNFKF